MLRTVLYSYKLLNCNIHQTPSKQLIINLVGQSPFKMFKKNHSLMFIIVFNQYHKLIL